MKVYAAAVETGTGIINAKTLLRQIARELNRAKISGASVAVFPGLLGVKYAELSGAAGIADSAGFASSYLQQIQELSGLHPHLYICPGSYYTADNGALFHESCVVKNGALVLCERQKYLRRVERECGLSRGTDARIADVFGWKFGILLPVDMYYPQVGRRLAMAGADIVLCPAAYLSGCGMDEYAGAWREAAINQFFAVQSGYTGSIFDEEFCTASAVYGPAPLSEGLSGCIAEGSGGVSALLDGRKRRICQSLFDPLRQINNRFIENETIFGSEAC